MAKSSRPKTIENNPYKQLGLKEYSSKNDTMSKEEGEVDGRKVDKMFRPGDDDDCFNSNEIKYETSVTDEVTKVNKEMMLGKKLIIENQLLSILKYDKKKHSC